jgi:hypothetical protein
MKTAILLTLACALVVCPVPLLAEDDEEEHETPLTLEQEISLSAQESLADSIASGARLHCSSKCSEGEEVYLDCVFDQFREVRRELKSAARAFKVPTGKVVPDAPTLLGQVKASLFQVAQSCEVEPAAPGEEL